MNEPAIRKALRQVGYEFIQLDARLPKISASFRPDVLAWAANAEGKLVPWAVVEVKQGRMVQPPEFALPVLAKSRDLLGTVDHYAVVNGSWYRADVGLRTFTPVDGPEPPPYGGYGELDDVDLATAIVTDRLWRWADQQRRQGRPEAEYLYSSVPLDFGPFQHETELEASVGLADWLPASQEVLWEARRRAAVDFARRGREAGVFTSHPVIANAVAALAVAKLERDVFDPFCGTGSFLWEAIDHAREHGQRLSTALGFDASDRIVELARSIGSASPVPVEITHADAFTADLPLSTCVVSAPPLGLRTQQQYELLDGTMTRDGEYVAVDRILRVLADGGRAVLHLGVGFTFRTNGERFRRYVADHFRVAAVIGCPPGAVPGVGIRSVVLVIDNAEPGGTFVGQLGEDWETQLALGGAALEAALEHIDGVRQ
ncbi:MAG TPA: N-6 DNA methylase [Streptosporangiaceae bacterium]|nr:N-6 DNA methylase [Streptosporangiaceae bacterium]